MQVQPKLRYGNEMPTAAPAMPEEKMPAAPSFAGGKDSTRFGDAAAATDLVLQGAKTAFQNEGWFGPLHLGLGALIGNTVHSGLQTLNKLVNTNAFKKSDTESLATLAKIGKKLVPGADDAAEVAAAAAQGAAKGVKETI
jgi:hypothetical protein